MEEIRKSEKVFDSTAEIYTYDVHNDSVLCIMRRTERETFFGIFNFSGQDETAWMKEEGEFTDLLTGAKITLDNLRIPGQSFYWIKGRRS